MKIKYAREHFNNSNSINVRTKFTKFSGSKRENRNRYIKPRKLTHFAETQTLTVYLMKLYSAATVSNLIYFRFQLEKSNVASSF